MSSQVQLLQLAKEEMLLYNSILSIHTPLREKMAWLQQSGVIERYQNVHATYADLSEHIEALKRGLFLTWYSLTEHPALTGLLELSVEASNKLVVAVQKRLKLHLSDFELRWMVNHYVQWDYFNTHYPNVKAALVSQEQGSFIMPVHIDSQQMDRRGQMGIYWNSLFGFM